MTEKQDTGANPEEPVAAGAAGDEDIEAVLQSMQGELDDLSGMLANDPGNPDAAQPEAKQPETAQPEGAQPEMPVADTPPVDTAPDVAPEPQAALADESATSEMSPPDDAVARQKSAPLAARPEPKIAADTVAENVPEITNVEPPVEQIVVPEMLRPNPVETAPPPPASTGFATSARQAFSEPIPQPQPRRARASRRARGAETAPVESAILGLAGFLEDEVNVLWEDARGALADITAYRDQMEQAVQRFEALEREMQSMRDELALARRESRNLQQQTQNLRDDAARARQRADQAALDAQSAADRAVSAAREIETAASMSRSL